MFDRIKNLKIVSKANEISPKLKWLMYDGIKDYKINSEYLEMMTGGELSSGCTHAKLEAMVRDMITREFSDKIKDKKSFEMLVDATVHRIKAKQLQAMGDID
ncbi:hypothetical protein IJ732_04135 [bacterium]|nr:hypothetical protein [bacterium]